MAAPVTPSQFKALIVSPTANLCTAFLRALIQLPTVLWKLVNYMFTSGGEISAAFCRDIIPSGTLLFSASAVPPSGYLLANGSIVQREDYPELFDAIGTTYGAGNDNDGGKSFTLPNFRDKFPLGAGPTYTFGTTGGAAEVALTIPQLPAHKHYMFINGSHGTSRSLTPDEHVYERGAFSSEPSYNLTCPAAGTETAPDVGPSQEVGGDEAHSNMPPYFTCYVYIKT